MQLRSASPFDAPKIQPNFLSHADDVATAARAVHCLRSFAETHALSRIIDTDYHRRLMTAEEAIADANILHPELSNSTAASAYVQNIPAPPTSLALSTAHPEGGGWYVSDVRNSRWNLDTVWLRPCMYTHMRVSYHSIAQRYVRANGTSIYHSVGTCAMGQSLKDGSVVDKNLRVHGTGGLRVVDASVMPQIPSGNTNAATLFVAQMASEKVLDISNIDKYNQ